jgi:DNA-binding NarL/FixJ family response regulator
LVDRDLVASCEQAKTSDGQSLYKVSLRPLRKFDLLTARERDVAAILASGKTHKETARLLGVAPSTIRNQTQSIYEKLCIDNRASLTKHVLS